MKRLKKGPELNLAKLKSGKIKLPAPVGDLYRELKSQHLLPIVLLLVVGLVAVPVLIGGSSDDARPTASQPKIKGSTPHQAAFEVTKWTPGLLSYKKTLRGSHPTDPFASKVSGTEGKSGSEGIEPAPEPAQIEVPSEGSEGGGGASPEPEESPSPGEEGGDRGGQSSEEESETIPVDVQVTTVHEDGGVDRAPVRHDIPSLTKLPSEAIPAVTYVGPSDDGKKAMMAVSSEVTTIVGDSNCVVPAKPCSLLALEVGAPETIVYGERGLTYRIELIRIGDHSDAPGNSSRNHPSPGNGEGPSPAPRGANALIGVGGGHRLVDPSAGF